MEKAKEKILDALSKISRGSALFLLFGLVCAALFQIPTTQNLLANLVIPVASDFSKISDATDAFSTSEKLRDLGKKLSGTPGAERFLEDAKTWNHVESVKIRKFSNGFFLSLLAGKGDILHPFFGFFLVEEGKVSEVRWSPKMMGRVEKLEKTADSNYFVLSLQNVGEAPWAADEAWENASTGEKAILVADTLVGGTGIFVFHKSDSFLPKNTTHEFVVTGGE